MYLVAYYFQKPANNRVKTARAGWMNVPGNLALDEQVALATKLKPKDLSMAKVILDLRRRQIVRNSWNSQTNYDDLFDYYQKNYPKYAELMTSVNTATMRKINQPEVIVVPETEVRVINTP